MSEYMNKPKIGIIIGSNRPRRICRTIAEWVLKEMNHDRLILNLIDLAEIDLPFLDEPEIPAHHNYQKDHTQYGSVKG